MNCQAFRKHMAELLDKHSQADTSDLLEHVKVCPECAKELAESQALLSALSPSRKVTASTNLKERIMNKVVEMDSVPQARRSSPVRKGLARFAVAAAVIAVLALGTNWYTNRNGVSGIPALQVLAQAAEAAENLKTLYIKAQMRTIANDNFDLIKPEEDFVPVEIWSIDDGQPKWRVEKPGRVVVMDGSTTTMIRGTGRPNPTAYKVECPATGLIGWLAPLLQVHSLLEKEQMITQEQGSTVTIEQVKDSSGAAKTVLTIQAKAQGDFSESKHRRNTSVLESDNIRVYTFDPQTHRLAGMKVYIDKEGERVLVFEISEIEYDKPLSASLFELSVPEDATWYKRPDQIAGTPDNSSMSPKEATEAIFKACAESDWDTLRGFAGTDADNPSFREYLGGLTIISIGKPFKSGLYPGWFVPYEIKLKNGETKKYNLAIRNDNPKHLWMLDGGI